MAATNFTPIQLYHSTTTTAVPVNTNLVDGELAINITDGKLFYKDNSGTVQVIATKATGTIGGSTTQVQYNNAGVLAGSANFTFNGTTATINTLNLTNALGAAYGGTAQSSYTQGDIIYATGTTTLAKLGIGLVNYILTSTGAAPQWTVPTSVSVNTATNLAGGAAGSVPYQSGAGATTFLSIGTANQVLTSLGTAPQWSSGLSITTLTASDAVTFSAITQNIALGTSQTSGTWTAGGAAQTGNITLDQSTKAHTLNIGTGATENATTKTINIGTGGVSGSTTTMTIGSTNGTSVTANGSWSYASNPTFSGGTANGVVYLNASKVATSGSALTYNGTSFGVGSSDYGNAGTINLSVGLVGTTTGGVQLWSTTSGAHSIQWGDGTTGSDPYRGAIEYAHSDDSMRFYVGAAEKMRLGSAVGGVGALGIGYTSLTSVGDSGLAVLGNVGIGTSSPAYKLAVSNGTQTGLMNPRASAAGGLAVGTDVASAGHVLNLAGDLAGGGTGGGVNVAYYSSASSTWNAAISIRNTASAYSNLLLMPDGGNVGIGTSSPGYKLDVSGQVRALEGGTGSGDGGLIGSTGSASGNAGVLFQTNATSRWNLTTQGADGANLRFYNYALASTVATFDSSGNLGLGVIPSGWTPGRAIEVGVAGSALYGFSAGTTILTAGAYYDGSWRYANSTTKPTFYNQADGLHYWYTAPSGTAGNAISFTQAMTLDASGNLGVGTTSPDAKLDVTVAAGLAAIFGSESAANAYTGWKYNSTTLGYVGNGSGVNGGSGATDFGIGSTGARALTFGTNDTERARITSGGYFKASSTGAYLGSTGGYHELRGNTDNNNAAIVSHNGTNGTQYGLSIRTTDDQNDATRNFLECLGGATLRAAIYTNGGLSNYSANNVNLASDERLKKDISPLGSTWGKVKAIEVVNFRYKDCNEGDPALFGVIAQQVQPIVPELVVVTQQAKDAVEAKDAVLDADGNVVEPAIAAKEATPEYYGIREQPMYWLAIKALQEAMARIETLEAEVAALKGA